jgi:hypothetical protein
MNQSINRPHQNLDALRIQAKAAAERGLTY